MDIIVNGEGEITFPHLFEVLCNDGNLNKVQLLTYRKDDTVINTGPAPFADLDRIPSPDYDGIPLAEANYKYIPCETSRGCPNNCSFCEVYPHKNWRPFPPQRVVEAMRRAHKYTRLTSMQLVHFFDSNFVASAKHIGALADLIDDEIPTYAPTRLEQIDERIAACLQKMGVKGMFAGVETVSPDMLDSISKNINVNLMEKKCELLLAHNISPRLSFIFGLPDENKNSVIFTLRYMKHTIEVFGEDMNIVVFPFRQDIATSPREFERYKSLHTVADSLMPTHDQKFRVWVLALVYLVNTFHNTLPPEKQIAMFDTLMKSSPRAVIEMARNYDGKQRPWLHGFRNYFQLGRSK